MMKKIMLFGVIFLFLIIGLSFLVSADDTPLSYNTGDSCGWIGAVGGMGFTYNRSDTQNVSQIGISIYKSATNDIDDVTVSVFEQVFTTNDDINFSNATAQSVIESENVSSDDCAMSFAYFDNLTLEADTNYTIMFHWDYEHYTTGYGVASDSSNGNTDSDSFRIGYDGMRTPSGFYVHSSYDDLCYSLSYSVDVVSPVHNASDVDANDVVLSYWLNFTDGEGVVTTYVGKDIGGGCEWSSFSSNVTNTSDFYSVNVTSAWDFNFGSRYFWYVEYDNVSFPDGGYDTECGHECWSFFTPSRSVTLISPLHNATDVHPNDTFSFYVNNTNATSITFWYYEVPVGVGFASIVTSYNYSLSSGSSLVTVNLCDYFGDGEENRVLFPNRRYYWGMNFTNASESFPQSPNGSLFYVTGEGYMERGWAFNTTEMDVPDVSVSICDESYTSETWDSDMTMTIGSSEGIVSLDIIMYCAEDDDAYMMVFHDENTNERTSHGDYSTVLYDVDNDTVFDLSEYVFWDNMNYSFLFLVYDSNYSSYWPMSTFTCNFSIGTYENLSYYLGFKDIYPAHKQRDAIDVIGSGFSYKAICNKDEYPGMKIYFALTQSGDEYQDVVQMVNNDGQRVYWTNIGWDGSTVHHSDDTLVSSGLSGWQSYVIPSSVYVARETYRAYLGFSRVAYNYTDVEVSCLYDDVVETNWTYHITDYGSNHVYEFYDSDTYIYPYYGILVDFSTYESDDAYHGDDEYTGSLGTTFRDAEDELGITPFFLSFVSGLLLIFVFSIMPLVANYYLFRPNHKGNVPFPVQVSFSLFGVILAFSMGLLPLWILALGFALLLLYVVYSFVLPRLGKGGGESE